MIFPELTRFKEDILKYKVIPVYEEIRADYDSPITIFLKTKSSFFLESVERGENVGRYSIITGGELVKIVLNGKKIKITTNGLVNGAVDKTVDNPFDYASNYLKAFNCPEYEGLPPFYSGIIGYLGYESIQYFTKVPTCQEDNGIPDGLMIIPEYVLVYDSVRRTVFIVVTIIGSEGDTVDNDKLYKDAENRIANLKLLIKSELKEDTSKNSEKNNAIIEREDDPEEYLTNVKKCKKYIKEGELIQAVISRRKELKVNMDPFQIYQTLRQLNPSPYMFFLDLDGFYLIGSSPEVMVKVQNGVLLTKPIAGTIKRGKTEDIDMQFEKDLLNDPKERAEHLMLVDLARNDLGRIAKAGTVEVKDYMRVEKYSHVMHIASTVRASLSKKYDSFDVIKSVFPAGTLSGAPKIRAMEIVTELEGRKRGPYGGMIFYLGFNGNLDSCITIRTIVLKDGIAQLQAGAGIVNDSVPESEFEETENKLSAIYEAIKNTGVSKNGGSV